MPDFLTPEERAAISAFPATKVKVIPRGQSGLDPLLPVRPARVSKAKWKKSRALDESIRALVKQGLSEAEIANATNTSVSIVKGRKRLMGISK